MFDNLFEDYAQFIIMISFFLIGAVVYGGYLYYKKQEDIKKVNDNLQNVNNSQQPSQQPQQPSQQLPDFISSDTFKGKQKGYIFKKDKEGTGYYKEN